MLIVYWLIKLDFLKNEPFPITFSFSFKVIQYDNGFYGQ